MEQRFIICGFLFPTDKNPPEAVYPGSDPFHHPASSAVTTGAFGDLFLPTRFDVRPIAAASSFVADDGRIKPLVAALMLRMPSGRTRAANWNAIERGMKKFLVMHICAANGDAQRHAPAIGQHRSLDSQFAPIRGIFAGFFPRPREPWSLIRPDFATAIECHAAHRTCVDNTSITDGRRADAPIAGNNCARRCRNQIPLERLSIGSPCEGRKKCRRLCSVDRSAVVRPCGNVGILAGTSPCGPISRRVYANWELFVRRT